MTMARTANSRRHGMAPRGILQVTLQPTTQRQEHAASNATRITTGTVQHRPVTQQRRQLHVPDCRLTQAGTRFQR